MLKRHYVTPETTYKVGGNRQVIYTPVIVIEDSDSHSHIYCAGRTSRTLDGDVLDLVGREEDVGVAELSERDHRTDLGAVTGRDRFTVSDRNVVRCGRDRAARR